MVAADKPSGWLTVPSRMGAADPRPCLGRQIEAALGVRLWPVHRLDLEVSGLVLFAKTAAAHRAAGAAFETRRVHKVYEALTEGADLLADLPATFDWQSRLGRGKRRSFEAPHGALARTHARAQARIPAAQAAAVLGPLEPPDQELVHFVLEPETGRPHQLRVHLARAGFPVAGDTLYGARTHLTAPATIALRSVRLAFASDEDRAALGLSDPLTVPGLL